MKTKKIIQSMFVVMLLVLSVMLSACNNTVIVSDGNKPSTKDGQGSVLELGTYEEGQKFDFDSDVKTMSFGSTEELQAFIDSHGSDSGYYYGGMMALARNDMVMEEAAMDVDSAPQAIKTAGGDDGGLDYSETNNQVQGVDEADIIKTDGNYIYTVTDGDLFIVKAYPGEDAEIVSTLNFDDEPSSLFIYGDKMAVFGNLYDLDFITNNDFRPRSGMTYFNIYDISDRENPELEKEYKFEGNYFNARLKGNYVYFVVKSTPESRPIPMPIYYDGVMRKNVDINEVYYFDIPYDSTQFVSIHSIDLDEKEKIDSKTLAVEYSQDMYMSDENIYITYTESISEWEIEQDIKMEFIEPMLTDSDKKLIEKIKQTDNDVLSQSEKEQKIQNIYYDYLNYMDNDEREELQDKVDAELMKRLEEIDYFQYTVINKVNVDDGIITVEDNGKVPGRIINQFSLDEHQGNLRIGTTISSRWSSFEKERTESTNNVYVLDEDMEIIGELEGLAPGESIYSTRFMGDRLYMVTYKQVDPFFVIDLSDPKNPEELGKLKIPGFSRYLHPYDDNVIIGLGRDATETGRTKGLKISLFDVTDVNNPEEIAKFVTDERYASSTAEYEHKAFLFSKEKELLVIPAYSYEWDDGQRQGYNGALVFKITEDNIELRGLIDHSKASESKYYYSSSVERSLYIEDMLYTKSPTLLRINDLEDLHAVKDVALEAASTSSMPIY